MGCFYEELEQFDKAFEIHSSAELNDFAPSIHRLASFYRLGLGVPQDNEKFLRLEKKAAKLGYFHSKGSLAKNYSDRGGLWKLLRWRYLISGYFTIIIILFNRNTDRYFR